MRSITKFFLPFVLAASLVTPVMGLADPSIRIIIFSERPRNPILLLGDRGVPEELKLSPEQAEKVDSVVKDIGKKIKEEYRAGNPGRQVDQDKIMALEAKYGKEMEKRLAGVLKPEQSKRLKEIALQLRGREVWSDEDVLKKLQITDDQEKKIQTIRKEADQELSKLQMSLNRRSDRDEYAKKHEAILRDTLKKQTAILTPEQRKTWTEMLGKPFENKPKGPGKPNGGK